MKRGDLVSRGGKTWEISSIGHRSFDDTTIIVGLKDTANTASKSEYNVPPELIDGFIRPPA